MKAMQNGKESADAGWWVRSKGCQTDSQSLDTSHTATVRRLGGTPGRYCTQLPKLYEYSCSYHASMGMEYYLWIEPACKTLTVLVYILT